MTREDLPVFSDRSKSALVGSTGLGQGVGHGKSWKGAYQGIRRWF